jgi:signal transduction histidine kinase
MANKDNIAQLQVIYGKEKVETELENEKNKNSLLSKENELKQTRVNAIIVISIFVLLITIGLIYIRHVRLTRKQQQEFTSKLISNIDEERSRISKDLHDDIGQSLSVIKSKINMFTSGKINDISGMDNDVGDVIDQTRSISHALHPSFIQKLGLERSLVSLTENTQSKTGLICSLDLDEAENLDFLNPDAQTQVYRIIQECINNTLKHAEATALKISITQHATEFVVKYQDNGIGISDVNKSIDGIGLQIIQERAMNIKGKVQINTGKGKGYTLVLTFTQFD